MWVSVRCIALIGMASCLPTNMEPLPAELPISLAATAKKLVGATSLSPYHMGSVGFVRAVLVAQGVDPFDVPAAFDRSRSGVELLYQFAALRGRFHLQRTPATGDLVFFGNTRDLDRDGRPDALSHVGIVVGVDPYGTAHVAMGTMTRVVSLPMNLRQPHEGLPLNGSLLSHFSPTQPQRLGELFYTFARLGP